MNRPKSPPEPPAVRERRVLVSYPSHAKAERLAGGKGARAFSDLVHGLAIGAEEALAQPIGRAARDDAE